MEEQLGPLILELCHLANTRNEINTRRHRARGRKNYYEHAIRVVEAHNGTNSELRTLGTVRHQARINTIKSDMDFLKKKYPNPDKWKVMGLHKLRSLSLKAYAEYSMAKHETMEFTIKTRERISVLTSQLECSLYYSNGSIESVGWQTQWNGKDDLTRDDILKYAEQYELDRSLEGMIQE